MTPDIQKSAYWSPMFEALKTLQWKLTTQNPEIIVSGWCITGLLIEEMRTVVDEILRNTAWSKISWVTPEPTYGFQIPDFPDFSLSVLANEPWITDATLAAVLFAWLAQKDLRGFHTKTQ